MKKLQWLAGLILISVLVLSFTGWVNGEEGTQTIDLYSPESLEGAAGNRAITGSDTIAIAITIEEGKEFVSFTSVEQPTYGDFPVAFTWSVYKWDTDFHKTLREENRVFSKRETNYIQYKNLTYTFENPLPAGTYLIVLSDPDLESEGGNVGVFCHKGKEGVDVFFNGELVGDTSIRFRITIRNAVPQTEPNVPTGDLSFFGFIVVVILGADVVKRRILAC
jgi:hypothetical protein